MKKKSLSLLFLPFIAISSFAQTNASFIGSWQGKINPGVELRVIFHITEDGRGGLVATTDSPDQAAYGIKCDTIIINGEKISIKIRKMGGSFEGRMLNDSTIGGKIIQQIEIPITLKKGVIPIERMRPQTPQPPFPYKSEDIEYTNADGSIRYGATITIPAGPGPFPAAILITGSGAQTRDEDIMGHKLFAVLADHLTRKGFILLRVDDRGVGRTTGKFSEATSEDFANDVSTGIDFLLSRPEVNKLKLGMIGHSEGGMIAPMVAIKRKDISFIVLLAGPGVKIIDLMTGQGVAILRSSGVSEPAIAAYGPLYKQMLGQTLNSPDTGSAIATVKQTMEAWVITTEKKLVVELGLDTPEGRNSIVSNLVQPLHSPWFKYFIAFDPQPYLERLSCKVLAINGDKDIQVISQQNLPAIEAALKKSKSPAYLVKELPGLNHLFQTCIKCNLLEYGELEESFSPVALTLISEWLVNNIK